jgi:hypothetical protein
VTGTPFDDESLPRDNGELVFDAPWQARALAIAVAVVERLGLPRDAFRHRLMASIAEDPHRPYYESWTRALESLVVTVVSSSGVMRRVGCRGQGGVGRC